MQYFKDLTINYPPNYKYVQPSLLSSSSRFSKYLRLAVGYWISTNEVNIAYVVPQYWMEQQESSYPLHESPSDKTTNKAEILSSTTSTASSGSPTSRACGPIFN